MAPLADVRVRIPLHVGPPKCETPFERADANNARKAEGLPQLFIYEVWTILKPLAPWSLTQAPYLRPRNPILMLRPPPYTDVIVTVTPRRPLEAPHKSASPSGPRGLQLVVSNKAPVRVPSLLRSTRLNGEGLGANLVAILGAKRYVGPLFAFNIPLATRW